MEQGTARTVPEPPDSALAFLGEHLGTMQAYVALLGSTGVDHGLIGPREVPRLWDRHILNCGVVGELIPVGIRIADVGSGAGLPGVVLAIARPDLQVTLVEPLQRRVVWLENAIMELGLSNIVVRRERAEQAAGLGVDMVTARAVAALPKLARWCLPLLRDQGTMLALKGASASAELQDARQLLTREGAIGCDIVQCGTGVIDPPTTVIRVTAGSRARRGARSRRTSNGPGGARR